MSARVKIAPILNLGVRERFVMMQVYHIKNEFIENWGFFYCIDCPIMIGQYILLNFLSYYSIPRKLKQISKELFTRAKNIV